MAGAGKIELHKADLQEKLKEVKRWNISDDDKKHIPKFVRDYELGLITRKRGNNPEANILRNLYSLKVGLENVNKHTEEQVKTFLERLLKDEIGTYNQKTQQYDGNPYAMRSKKAILKILSYYLKWKYKTKSYKLCRLLDLDIGVKERDIDYINEEELEKLCNGLERIERKFLVRFLFYGGMRAEEFHNIRISDITLPGKDNKFIKVRLKGEHSKTKGRTIQVYDKELVVLTKDFISLRRTEGALDVDPLYKLGYDGNRKWLRREGERLIGKGINYHLFRHSSAILYASKMNRQQLCYYFGWRLSSNMPDVYINREGIDMQDVTKKMEAIQNQDLEGEIEKIKEESRKEMEDLKKKFNQQIEDMHAWQEQVMKHYKIKETSDKDIKKVHEETMSIISQSKPKDS